MASPTEKPPVRAGEQRTAHVYAEAFLNAAEAAGQAEAAVADFFALHDELFPAFPNAETYLTSAVVPVGARDEVIDKALGGQGSPMFVNFMHVLNHHGRLNLLGSIRQELRDLIDERAKRRRVYVQSAVPLTDELRGRLLEVPQRGVRFERQLVESVDPELLGGFVVRALDYRFDGSVRTYLDSLKKQLTERSSHAIQSRRDRFSPAG